MSVKVKEIDRGFKKILENARKLLKSPKVKVGWLESSGGHKKADLTVAEIASIHEYGTHDGKIPERAPLRKTLAQSKTQIASMQSKLLNEVIFGKMDVESSLKILGEFVKAEIQQTIRAGLTPEWAESTLNERIRRSGGIVAITPLIDSGQLLRSIHYKVEMNGLSIEGTVNE